MEKPGLSEMLRRELPGDASAQKIESTACDLESMRYEPVLLLKTPGFFRMTKAELCREIDWVVEVAAAELSDELKPKHIQLLVYHYELLCRLRADDPAAWDTVNELYEDD
jgi:hypothetical protein